jgi:hypothetical protein
MKPSLRDSDDFCGLASAESVSDGTDADCTAPTEADRIIRAELPAWLCVDRTDQELIMAQRKVSDVALFHLSTAVRKPILSLSVRLR